MITGHTGFKGSWLCLMLESLGASVAGYSLPGRTDPSLYEMAHVAEHVQSVDGDVRDLDALSVAVNRCRPEIIIHMAAQPLVRQSYVSPVDTFATNVMGTVHILEAARHCDSVRALVNVTTDKCYENHEWVWGYRENEPMGGHDPYSCSKGCSELVTSAYRRSFFEAGKSRCAIGSGRAGNVIGGGDWATDRLIPDCIRALAAGKPIPVRNPRSVRPWQFVMEPLSGYLLLAQKLCERPAEFSEGWNFGPAEDDARSVEWIADHMVKLWGLGAAWQATEGSQAQAHEANYLKLDCSKARGQLGWTPRTDLAMALEWTVEWYRHMQAGGDVRQICLDQVNRFFSLGR
jgi:CDP-glucose 4,6-dehydratase